MDTEEEGADQESPNCDEESEIDESDRSTASETESSGIMLLYLHCTKDLLHPNYTVGLCSQTMSISSHTHAPLLFFCIVTCYSYL